MEETVSVQTNKENRTRIMSVSYILILFTTVYLYLSGLITDSGVICILYLMISDILLFLVTLIVSLLSGAKLNRLAIVSLVFGLVSSASVWINGNCFENGILYFPVRIVSYSLFVLALFGNRSKIVSGWSLIIDSVKSTLFYPLISFSALFKALFRRTKKISKQSTRTILYIVAGVVASLILGVIVVSILSYDPKFRNLFRFEIKWDDLPLILLRFLLSVPITALLFGTFISSKEHKYADMSSDRKIDSLRSQLKCIPFIIFTFPAITLLIIYGLFFISQWDVYVSAFSGVLPSSFTFAEYARSGFFELCCVAFINTVFCMAFHIFSKEPTESAKTIRKIVISLLSTATLILIATALSKMILYIRSYDLTVLRLYTSVTMILIAIGFILTILYQWIPKVKVFPVILLIASVLILSIPFANVRGRIAAYNVDAYIQRCDEKVNNNHIDYLYLVHGLGDAGIHDAIRLFESGKLQNIDDERNLFHMLEDAYSELNAIDPCARTFANQRALNDLKEFFEKQ